MADGSGGTHGPVGVLLMAYGSPAAPADVEAYYTHIRRGRPPSAEELADLHRRYEAIGGISPLLERTQAQVAGVQAALDEMAPGRYRCVLGMKHAPPFLEDAVAALHAGGVLPGSVALVLAPHYSELSVGEYLRRVEAAADPLLEDDDAGLTMVEHWHLDPGLVDLLAERLERALDAVRAQGAGKVKVLFSAHSLPERVRTSGDPYPSQLRETAAEVAACVGVWDWDVAWQSAPAHQREPWLGPDVRDVVRALPDAGFDGVVVAPVGFVSSHLEVLYDLDIDTAAVAKSAGVAFARTESLDADPRFCRLLAEVVHGAATSDPDDDDADHDHDHDHG